MTATDPNAAGTVDATATGLARWLTEAWGRAVDVTGLRESSAGARRRNVLFDAHVDGTVVPLAATILPTAEIQIIDVATEAAVRSVAERCGVLVPHVHGVCTDTAYVGGPFFISDRIEGETVGRRILRQATATGHGETVVGQIGGALAHLHAIDPSEAPPGLPGSPTMEPIANAMVGLTEAVAGLLRPEPAFSYGLRWLRDNQPDEPAACTIIHTDVRNGNIIVGPEGLRAILDWEGSRFGDPMEDVAWPCTRMWRFGDDDKMIGGLAGLAPYRAGYEGAGGMWNEERFRWWRVLVTLRWGTGLAGQTAAHLDGRFRSIVMAGSGRRVIELAYDMLRLIRP
jgi:aminoglycoside phosphotransferase (APT) family kinase protein